MKLLEGKKGLITGVVNHRSIAWAIAELFLAEGAEIALTHGNEDRWIYKLGHRSGIDRIYPCDVRDDQQMNEACRRIGEEFQTIDFFVHAIAYAPAEELTGGILNTTRRGFTETMEISVFSLIALANGLYPYLADGGSVISLSYLGAERVCAVYNVMGAAKAALESTNRYLAEYLGRRRIRSNVISAGPVRTLAGMGLPHFAETMEKRAEMSPIHSNISKEDVAGTALYLASDLSTMVTGQVIHVDAGYHIMGTWAEKGKEGFDVP